MQLFKIIKRQARELFAGKTKLAGFFLILGYVSMTHQLVLLRELSISFQGNELIYVLGFLYWFSGIALGSMLPIKAPEPAHQRKKQHFPGIIIYWIIAHFQGLKHRLFRHADQPTYTRSLRLLSLMLLGVLPAQILMLRAVPQLMRFAGEIAPVSHFLVILPLCIMPVCALYGRQFSLGVAHFSPASPADKATTVRTAYFWELTGLVLGSSLYTLFAIWTPSLYITFALMILEYLIVITLWHKSNSKRAVLILIACMLAVFALSLPSLEPLSNSWRYRDQKNVTARNTLYGNIAVTQTDTQYNFYENGVYTGTGQEDPTSELTAHLPLLMHTDPQHVLLIGHGYSGIIQELVRYPNLTVTALELDPYYISIIKEYLPSDARADLGHPRVHLVFTDGISYLRSTSEQYDAIIINTPAPTNFQFNRWYTREFYRLAAARLTDDGILSTILPAAPNRLTTEQQRVSASILAALQNVFPNVFLIHDQGLRLFATNDTTLRFNADMLTANFGNSELKTEYLSLPYLAFLANDTRHAALQETLEQTQPHLVNSILYPGAYLYETIDWLSRSSDTLVTIFRFLVVNNIVVLLILILLTGSWILLLVRRKTVLGRLALSMGIISATTMALEITIIFLFQSFSGYAYSAIAVIITLLMFGMLIGNTLMNELIDVQRKLNFERVLILCHSVVIVLLAFLLTAVRLWGEQNPALLSVVVFPLCLIGTGIAEGCTYPAAQELFAHSRQKAHPGWIYSADVLGAGLGTIIFPFIGIPLYGIPACLAGLLCINFIPLIIHTLSKATA
ncbi:MAG TPA: hypothetical protein PKL83_04135 [bacterium]|nr:hypothetical protein [bacterium]